MFLFIIHFRITPTLVMKEHSRHQMIPISEIYRLIFVLENHPMNGALTAPLDEIFLILEG